MITLTWAPAGVLGTRREPPPLFPLSTPTALDTLSHHAWTFNGPGQVNQRNFELLSIVDGRTIRQLSVEFFELHFMGQGHSRLISVRWGEILLPGQ